MQKEQKMTILFCEMDKHEGKRNAKNLMRKKNKRSQQNLYSASTSKTHAKRSIFASFRFEAKKN
jgi:hypothetical protein